MQRVLILLIILIVLLQLPKPVPAPPQTTTVVIKEKENPEYRTGPYRRYAPMQFEPVGVLTADGQPTLPLYGKRSEYHRDRYNYYTVTPGDQLYPLTISVDGRVCTEDLGCMELYGNETVTVLGLAAPYTAQIYNIP